MNGLSTVNVDKIHSEELIIPDKSGGTSRFQTIRVDRNFGRGRWKVNDHELPETIPVSNIPLVHTNEYESINICSDLTYLNVHPSTHLPTVVNGDSNIIAPAALQQQQQQQQRMALNNTPNVVSTANVPPPAGFIHGYPPNALTNQSYIFSNPHRPQFSYFHFYPPPYSHYAPPWATGNPYLQPTPLVPPLPPQQSTTSQLPASINHNDPLRSSDTVPDSNGENTFPNLTGDPLQNAQFAAYLYALPHSHSPYFAQTSSTAPSYATIPSFHPVPPTSYPTILPPQTLPLFHNTLNNTTDIQQSHQSSTVTSPKLEESKPFIQQTSLITPKTKPFVTTTCNGINNDLTKSADIHDLMSSSPAPPTLISPFGILNTNTSCNIWSHQTADSPLNFDLAENVTMAGLINHESNRNTENTDDILKELKTPTKQNNTTDIDNEISAAMDLVKMHLLSAVREEVTELRQQIRLLNEKMNSMEHENAFLRQHVPSEIYAQYIPINTVSSTSNDSTSNNSVPSSQPVSINSSAPVQQTTANLPLT